MKFRTVYLLIGPYLLLISCAGGIDGHRWSADFAAQIHNGMRRDRVLSLMGQPYQTSVDDYSSDAIPNKYSDTWRHDGENLMTGRRTQEFMHIDYDKNLKVIRVKYNRNR